MGSCLKKSRNSTVVNKKKIVKPEGQHILVIKKKKNILNVIIWHYDKTFFYIHKKNIVTISFNYTFN